MKSCPPIVLWAWERPEDLSFIDTKTTGVAYLALRITATSDTVDFVPRTQKLRVAPDSYVIAVVRIESSVKNRPSFSDKQLREIAGGILKIAGHPGIKAIQIDFDAKTTERTFYRKLMEKLRSNLPGRMGLSMTSLASWCMHDKWIDHLPVDEVVPMLFRMGEDGRYVTSRLQAADKIAGRLLDGSCGLATDEKRIWEVTGKAMSGGHAKRVYLFSPRPWTQSEAEEKIKEVSSWLKRSDTKQAHYF